MKLKLLVIRCKDINKSRQFYEQLGCEFKEEKHEKGPVHYSSEREGFVFELYPAQKIEIDNTRLGFEIENLASLGDGIEVVEILEHNNIKVRVVIDPDGRKIELYEKP